MRSSCARPPWPIRLALAGYRFALSLYPESFRKSYEDELTQVFRTALTAANRSSGLRGVFMLMLVSCWDVVITALAERREQGVSMTQKSWMILGSFALIAASVLAIWGVVIQTVVDVRLDIVESQAGQSISWLRIFEWNALPSAFLPLLLAGGTVAFYLHVQSHIQRGTAQSAPPLLVRLGVSLVVIGATVATLGGLLANWSVFFANQSCSGSTFCGVYDPHHLIFRYRDVSAGGFLLYLLGFFCLGVLARRIPSLRRWSSLPIVLSLLPIVNVIGSRALLQLVIFIPVSDELTRITLWWAFGEILWWGGMLTVGILLWMSLVALGEPQPVEDTVTR